MPHEASKGGARDASLIAPRSRKTSTPSILKRDKSRKRVMVCTCVSMPDIASAPVTSQGAFWANLGAVVLLSARDKISSFGF